ncbi:MAG TPA: hypothetical protein VF343_08360, partial [Syntrophales bacterium]
AELVITRDTSIHLHQLMLKIYRIQTILERNSICGGNRAPALFFFKKMLTRHFSYYSCIYNYTIDNPYEEIRRQIVADKKYVAAVHCRADKAAQSHGNQHL